jgi:hypothetical protein
MQRETADNWTDGADTRVAARAFPIGSDCLNAVALGNLRLVLVLLILAARRGPGAEAR